MSDILSGWEVAKLTFGAISLGTTFFECMVIDDADSLKAVQVIRTIVFCMFLYLIK